MITRFFELALEVGAIFAVAPLDREGGFTEIVAQVGVAGAGEMGFFGLEFRRTRLAPFEAGELGDLRLLAVKAFHPADLSDDARRQNRSQAGDGGEGIGNGFHLFGNGGIQAFAQGFQMADVFQAETQDQIDGRLQGLRQGIGVTGNLLQALGILGGVGEAMLALLVQPGGQVLERQGGDGAVAPQTPE